tara:strand:+ start:272 stop:481 length:210 start_codon:yes stop_codon:yes gene_type:complete
VPIGKRLSRDESALVWRCFGTGIAAAIGLRVALPDPALQLYTLNFQLASAQKKKTPHKAGFSLRLSMVE